MDPAEVKQRQRQVWAKGDYSVLSGLLEPVAIELADVCAVSAGQEVLDVAAGDGNFALACAREGASVVATDLSPTMVERGRTRRQDAGYDVEWQEADAEELPFENNRFDCVGSVFGAIIAPRPEQVAAELMRVTRPGGTVGMTAWIEGGFTADLIALGRSFQPPDPDLPTTDEWGDEETARARFAPVAGSIHTEARQLVWERESADELFDSMERTFPPIVAAREAMPEDVFGTYREKMRELYQRHNQADGGRLRLVSDYLLIVARKRG